VGATVRVTAQVIETASGQIAHTLKLDGTLAEIFDLQAGSFARSREDCGSASNRTLAIERTWIVEAYEAFSKGVINLRAQTSESPDRAIMLFERAIALDPAYTSAHLGLGAPSA
jgi:hypothetical protein